MSTETTNKKIKIDNGTTFGRTYTDKAVDELLKNVGGGQVFFNLFMYYDEANNKITQEGWNKLSNGLINGTYCGILYDELPLVVIGFNGARTLYAFETTEEVDNASIKITVKSDLTFMIENIPVLNIPTLPSDASTKNYALNSVNGALTWNTIGDGLTIENGVLQTTGGGGSSILRKDGTFASKEADGTIINTISLSSEESTKIRNGEINIIYGVFQDGANSTSNYKVDFTKILDNMYIYANTAIDENNETITIVYFQLILTGETASLYKMKITHPSVPTLPSDAASKTYTLQAVSGVPTWNTTGGYVKIFQPPITNVNVSTFDENKKIETVFTANNEVETYIHSLVDQGKNFSANLFLKTLIINDYQIRLISPLSLINIRSGNNVFAMCGRLIQDVTSKIDFKLTFGSTNVYLDFYFDSEGVYTQFKQLASLLFTTDTLLKLTIKTDE